MKIKDCARVPPYVIDWDNKRRQEESDVTIMPVLELPVPEFRDRPDYY
jgi:hypothetical protein